VPAPDPEREEDFIRTELGTGARQNVRTGGDAVGFTDARELLFRFRQARRLLYGVQLVYTDGNEPKLATIVHEGDVVLMPQTLIAAYLRIAPATTRIIPSLLVKT
jgi:hypothetical protein